MDNTASKVTKICLIVFACIAAFLDVFYIYTLITNKNTTYGTAKANTLDVRDVEEKPYIMEVNIMDNMLKNGIELQELKFTYFTDIDRQDYYSTAMQYIGGSYKSNAGTVVNGGSLNIFGISVFPVKESEDSTLFAMNERIKNDFYWYDGWNGEAWPTIKKSLQSHTDTKKCDALIITMGTELYSMRLNKTSSFSNSVGGGFLYKGTTTFYENYGTFFEYVMTAIKGNSYGYGSFVLPLDISQFFTIQKFNESSTQFEPLIATTQKFYIEVKVNYQQSGANLARESILGVIKYDPAYNTTGAPEAEFWKYGVQYLVSKNDFELRYSITYGGYFLSLKDTTKLYLQNTERLITDVLIDLSQFNNVIGLDFHCFYQTQLRELTILGSGDFYLLDYSLNDTELQTLKKNNGINLIVSPSATNNEYMEVNV